MLTSLRERDRLAALHAPAVGLLLQPLPSRSPDADQAQAERNLQRTCLWYIPRRLRGDALLSVVGREELHVVQRLSTLQHDVPTFAAGRRISSQRLVGGKTATPDARQCHRTVRPRT